MPTDQWRASLLHADCMSVPSVCGSLSARRGTKSDARLSSSRSLASGLTTPLDPSQRCPCPTVQHIFSGLGPAASLRLLRLLPRSAHGIFHRFRIFEALQPCCDRVINMSVYLRGSTNRSAQSMPATHSLRIRVVIKNLNRSARHMLSARWSLDACRNDDVPRQLCGTKTNRSSENTSIFFRSPNRWRFQISEVQDALNKMKSIISGVKGQRQTLHA